MRAMERPKRKLANLKAKTEQKLSRSRRRGPKAKRWNQAIERFESMVAKAEGADDKG